MEQPARAVWFTGRREIEVGPVPVASPGDGEVVVRSTFSGISPGTEMLAYRGELDPDLVQDETIAGLDSTFDYPFRYGYSTVGVVEESRAEVPVGTQVFAFHPHQERLTAAADDLILMDGLSPREATLYPLVETAFQITLDADLKPGDRSIVMGLGPVGILTSLLFARMGVNVVAVDPLAWRREALDQMSTSEILATEPDSLAAVVEGTGGPVPMVVDASGDQGALRSGLGFLSHEGTLLVASWFGSREVTLPLGGEFHRRRLTIRSTQVSTIPRALQLQWTRAKRTEAVVELLGVLPLSVLATHTFPFEKAAEAYAAIDLPAEGMIHTALEYA